MKFYELDSFFIFFFFFLKCPYLILNWVREISLWKAHIKKIQQPDGKGEMNVPSFIDRKLKLVLVFFCSLGTPFSFK